MKTIVISDIHGRTIWEKIVKKEESDTNQFVFLGDYFDTLEKISAQQQKDNFKKIINFKKANLNKVILLFGNHSLHYLRTIQDKYTGYQKFHAIDISELLHSAIDNNYLQMCHIHDKFLFSHAGVTKTWCKNNNIDFENLEQSINDLFKYQPRSFKFTRGDRDDDYGDDTTQSPVWVRPRSLREDKIDNYIHVVGHTVQYSLITSGDIIFTDTLGTSGEYLEIKDGIPIAKTL